MALTDLREDRRGRLRAVEPGGNASGIRHTGRESASVSDHVPVKSPALYGVVVFTLPGSSIAEVVVVFASPGDADEYAKAERYDCYEVVPLAFVNTSVGPLPEAPV